MARIVTVYSTERRATRLVDMSYIRWFRMSAELARLGHSVDIATAEHKWRPRQPVIPMDTGLRRVPLARVRWSDYDVVKTLFHRGWETLERYGGDHHPFVIAKLGSVVAAEDVPGIYFHGRQRRRMFDVQRRIARRSRYVTVLTEPGAALWRQCFGPDSPVLIVPGAVDADIPPAGADPYPDRGVVRCLFAGNFYSGDASSQSAAHRTIAAKLNALGRQLAVRGARLYVLGPGDARHLDPAAVVYLGVATYDVSWNYVHHADVGIVVSAGPFMHNNESTKIYHYLRVGLPVVSEAGFPNDHVIAESGLGCVVRAANMSAFADAALHAAAYPWDRAAAIRYILERHTWTARARVYDALIRAACPA